MKNLLAKTRQLNRMLQEAAGKSVSFMEMAEVLSDIISANVYVMSRKGKVLGYSAFDSGIKIESLLDDERKLTRQNNDYLIQIFETTSSEDENQPARSLANVSSVFGHDCLAVIPIKGGRDRIGTLLITREKEVFSEADFVLAEYGATVIGMEILKEQSNIAQQETRDRAAVQIAVGSLSYSELEAVEHIFDELDEKSERLLVASKIADRAGITRSVIVNALRKLESAGVVETKSLGMKGTFIRLLNPLFFEEFARLR